MTETGENKYLTIPNAFSYARIILAVPVIVLIAKDSPDLNFAAFFIGFIAGITDYFDGWFARRLNQVSEIGKIVDPLADKIFVSSIIVALIIYRDFPLWYGLPVLFRDLIILILGVTLFRKKKVIYSSNKIGKITMFVYCVSLAVYVLDWDPGKLPLCLSGTFLVIVSSILYGIRMFRRKDY